MGMEVSDIKTILAENSFNEPDITYQFIVCFDLSTLFLLLKSSFRKV